MGIDLLYCCERCTQVKTHAWSNASVLLVGNKSDLEENRVVSQFRGQKLAEDLGITSYVPLCPHSCLCSPPGSCHTSEPFLLMYTPFLLYFFLFLPQPHLQTSIIRTKFFYLDREKFIIWSIWIKCKGYRVVKVHQVYQWY